MLPDSTLFLYSTNTWIAYLIGQDYYGGEHFVWCSPLFDSRSLPGIDLAQPPTSTPKEIYMSLLTEVVRGDRHSAKIKSQKEGIVRGASIRYSHGDLSERQLADIKDIVALAETRDFHPLLYVICFAKVKDRVKEVEISRRAHPLSQEFEIEKLPRDSFQVLDFASPSSML